MDFNTPWAWGFDELNVDKWFLPESPGIENY